MGATALHDPRQLEQLTERGPALGIDALDWARLEGRMAVAEARRGAFVQAQQRLAQCIPIVVRANPAGLSFFFSVTVDQQHPDSPHDLPSDAPWTPTAYEQLVSWSQAWSAATTVTALGATLPLLRSLVIDRPALGTALATTYGWIETILIRCVRAAVVIDGGG